MWSQIIWILVSLVGFILVWLPGLGSGRMRILMNWAGIAIFLVSWFWLPFTSQPRIPGTFGIVLGAIGLVFLILGLTLCTIGTIKISEVVGWGGHAEPSRLVTEGIYGFVRHPVYSGLFMGVMGWALIWGGVYSILLVPVLYLLLRLEAWLEEEFVLKVKFGEMFIVYQMSVPSFFTLGLIFFLSIIAILVISGILRGWVPLV